MQYHARSNLTTLTTGFSSTLQRTLPLRYKGFLRAKRRIQPVLTSCIRYLAFPHLQSRSRSLSPLQIYPADATAGSYPFAHSWIPHSRGHTTFWTAWGAIIWERSSLLVLRYGIQSRLLQYLVLQPDSKKTRRTPNSSGCVGAVHTEYCCEHIPTTLPYGKQDRFHQERWSSGRTKTAKAQAQALVQIFISILSAPPPQTKYKSPRLLSSLSDPLGVLYAHLLHTNAPTALPATSL